MPQSGTLLAGRLVHFLMAVYNYFTSGDYVRDVKDFYAGYGDTLIGTAAGLGQAGEWVLSSAAYSSPSEIARDLLEGAKAIPGAIATTWNSGSRGQGQIVGSALIAAGTIAAPYAKAGGATKAVATARGTASANDLLCHL